MYVTANEGSLVAKIADGNVRLVGISTTNVMDASSSYDEDNLNAGATVLAFQWTCRIISYTNYGNDCTSTIASNQRAKLLHISTDYVFDGESGKPYTETDTPNPINVYGRTKLAGEKALQTVMPMNALVIRTSWLYSEYDNNFVKSMLKLSKEQDELSVVNDQIGSPTYAADLADAILEIIRHKKFRDVAQTTQIYNYSGEGEISWHEFAKEIFKIEKIECEVNPVTSQQYPTPAKRPRNTIMKKDKIVKVFNIKISNWKSSLNTCMTILKKQQ